MDDLVRQLSDENPVPSCDPVPLPSIWARIDAHECIERRASGRRSRDRVARAAVPTHTGWRGRIVVVSGVFVAVLVAVIAAGSGGGGGNGPVAPAGSVARAVRYSGLRWSLRHPRGFNVERSESARSPVDVEVTVASFAPESAYARHQSPTGLIVHMIPPLDRAGRFPADGVALRLEDVATRSLGAAAQPVSEPPIALGDLRPSPRVAGIVYALTGETSTGGFRGAPRSRVTTVTLGGIPWRVIAWIGPQAPESLRLSLARIVASIEPDGRALHHARAWHPVTASGAKAQLGPKSIVGVPFGLPTARAVHALDGLLGRPFLRGINTGCGSRYREVDWGDLAVEFRLGRLSGYRYLEPGTYIPLRGEHRAPPPTGPTADLTTAAGITLGSTLGGARQAYPSLRDSGTNRWRAGNGIIFLDNASTFPDPLSSSIIEVKIGTCGDY